MKYNPRLDSIRALAILGVIGCHWAGLPGFGWAGVQLFFVLSSFLNTSILLRSAASSSTLLEFAVPFFVKRLLRLCPIYFTFIAVLHVAYLVAGVPSGFPSVAANLYTYTLNFACMLPDYQSGPYTHLWSIAVEWQFYFLLPLFLWFLPRETCKKVCVGAIGLAVATRVATHLALSSAGWAISEIATFIYNAPWTHCDAFGMGALLAFDDVRPKVARTLPFALGATVLAGVALLAIDIPTRAVGFGTLGYPGGMAFHNQYLWGYTMICWLSGSLIAAVVENSSSFSWTNHRALQYVGRVSYGMYIYHFPVILTGQQLAADYGTRSPLGLVTFAGAVAVTIMVSTVSYFLLEQPFLSLKRRFALQHAN